MHYGSAAGLMTRGGRREGRAGERVRRGGRRGRGPRGERVGSGREWVGEYGRR